MSKEQKVKAWMLQELQAGEYVDPATGEAMLTQLAEAAAWEFDLDLDDELPFELAYETAQRWERAQRAAGGDARRGASPSPAAPHAHPRPSSRAARTPDAVQ